MFGVPGAPRGRVTHFRSEPGSERDLNRNCIATSLRFDKDLSDNGHRVIALRDLARFVDPSVVPSNPWRVIEDRMGLLSCGCDAPNDRPPRSERPDTVSLRSAEWP
jgi:hypothetical protein